MQTANERMEALWSNMCDLTKIRDGLKIENLACIMFIYGFVDMFDDSYKRKKPVRRLINRVEKGLARAGKELSQKALKAYNLAINKTVDALDGTTIKPEKAIAAMFAHKGDMLRDVFNMDEKWGWNICKESGEGLAIQSNRVVRVFLENLEKEIENETA